MYRISLFIMILICSISTAYAQGIATKTYCAYDYLRHCSAYSLDSPDLKKCMANVGINLSKRCIQALVDDGLISKQDVISRAAKQGIVVRDGENGLYIDENAKIGEEIVTVEMPKEEVKAIDVGEETVKAVISVAEQVRKTTNKVYTKAKTAVKKVATAVKNKYKKVTKSNKEYAKRSDIASQNRIRKEYINGRNIAPEGINADFGRFEARRPGFTPPIQYDWKKRQESGGIYSSGVNGY